MNCHRPIIFVLPSLVTLPFAVAQEPTPAPSIIGLDHLKLGAIGYPDGVTDEDAYLQWLNQHAQRITALAERTTDKDLQRRRLAAAVNWSLAKQCEPGLSRLLNGIPRPDDRQTLHDLAHSGLLKLESLRQSLDSHPPAESEKPSRGDDADPDAETPPNADAPPENDETEHATGDAAPNELDDIPLTDAVDTLTAFARAIEAVASDHAEIGEARIDQAALDLSYYLEDDRPDIAAAALLWQACLHQHSGKPDRALRVLPPALTAPRAEARTCDYFARLLRCRYLLDRGSHATAWALLLALEERARDWFPTPREQADAVRSAIRLKLAICADWPARGNEPERDRTTPWCESAAQRLNEEHFANPSSATLLRLQSAIPLIVEVSDDELAAIDAPAVSAPPAPNPDASTKPIDSPDAPPISNDNSPPDESSPGS